MLTEGRRTRSKLFATARSRLHCQISRLSHGLRLLTISSIAIVNRHFNSNRYRDGIAADTAAIILTRCERAEADSAWGKFERKSVDHGGQREPCRSIVSHSDCPEHEAAQLMCHFIIACADIPIDKNHWFRVRRRHRGQRLTISVS